MIVELRQAWTPSDLTEENCGMCGHRFQLGSVYATLMADSREDAGFACMECVAYLGTRNPQRFPTIGEFARALRDYPVAMYPSKQALEAAVEAAGVADPSEIVAEQSELWVSAR